MTSLEDHVERIAIKGTALDPVGSGRQGEPLTFALRENGCGGRIRTYDLQVMSLTSYRTAPPRVIDRRAPVCKAAKCFTPHAVQENARGGWKTWRRPTLPRLKTQYHRR